MWRSASGVVVVCLLIVATAFAQQPGPAASQPGAPGTVTATASLTRREASVGEAVRFWVTIRNDGPTPITNVRVARIDAPGFTSTIGPVMPRAAMAAGEQMTVNGDLSATGSMTDGTAVLLLQWQDGRPSPQELAVPIGPFTASRPYVQWIRAIGEFVKDIALPLMLAFLAFRFRQWEQDRARRVADAERAQAEMRQREEQARAARLALEEGERTQRLALESQQRIEISETWRLMLPVGHRYVIKYYMPVVAAGGTALLITRKARGTSDPAHWKRAFHLWTLFAVRCRVQTDKLNGWYFKNRCGEEFAAMLHAQYQARYYGRPGTRARIDQVLSAVTPRGAGSRLHAFLEQWDSDEARRTPSGRVIDAEYQAFLEWGVGNDALLLMDVVEAFIKVVNFEMNRVYEPWYGKAETLSLEPALAAVVWAQVKPIASGGSMSEEELTDYLTAQGIARPDVTDRG